MSKNLERARECATCRFWAGVPSEAFGRCHGVPFNKAGVYKMEDPDDPDDPDAPKPPPGLAYVIDGSGFSATLHTRAEFGCMIWEAATDTGE